MSSTLRFSIIAVLLLATTALALLGYNSSLARVDVIPVAHSEPAPAITNGYFVAAHQLRAGTFLRDEDFEVRPALPNDFVIGMIRETPESRAEIRGSVVRNFVEAGAPIRLDDVLRPRDRGFLASVLAPDTRAISINVEADSGVSGLIWPGDYVDVILTQVNDKMDAAHRTMSETVLRNVRIVAIDQDLVKTTPGANEVGANKGAHSVSLQLSPEQVKKVIVARDLGKLSLAVRSAVELKEAVDAGTMLGCDVSPELARETAAALQNTTVEILENGKLQAYSVRKQTSAGAPAATSGGCGGAPGVMRQSDAATKPTTVAN